MNQSDFINEFTVEKKCEYKGEKYSVRDNGAVMRHAREGKKLRELDNCWTFGKKDEKTGYMYVNSHRVHIIVATAFYGEHDSKVYVVDHKDTNRCNNRSENLRWFTKLENALNNEYTRKKIEFLCGSIEAFIENPSILNTIPNLDPDISWMRTVTKEEAAYCKAHLDEWQKMENRPRYDSNRKIGQWIYKPVQTNREINRIDSSPKENIKQESGIVIKGVKDNLFDVIDTTTIGDIITLVCQRKGWNLQTELKGRGWRADFLITFNDKKVVFNNYLPPSKAQKISDKLQSEGTDVCWVGTKKMVNNNINCIFYEKKMVHLSESFKINAEEFVAAFVEGRIRTESTFTAKYIYLYYWWHRCARCGKPIPAYLIKKYESVEGMVVDHEDIYNHDEIKWLTEFDTAIIKKANEYCEENKDFEIKRFSIKERFSKTMQESYMSFGCLHCDTIYGSHHYQNDYAGLIYDDNPSKLIRLDIEDMDFVIPFKHWVFH